MLRIRSKLWNSRVYWGHWNKHNNQEDAHLKHGLPEQLVAAVPVGVVECRLDSFLVLIRLLGLGKEQPQLGEIIERYVTLRYVTLRYVTLRYVTMYFVRCCAVPENIPPEYGQYVGLSEDMFVSP